MATIKEQAAAIKGYAAEIDAAIVAKGGTTAGGLRNASAAIEALPSGGGEKYTKLAECLNALAGTIVVDTVECDELSGYVGGYFCDSSFGGTRLILRNLLGGSSQWEFSNLPNLEYLEANNLVTIGSSGMRGNKKLKTAYLDSLTTLKSSYSFAENTALEDLYIRKKSASELKAWTALLSRIPTACVVHGSDADVRYIDGAWVVVERS